MRYGQRAAELLQENAKTLLERDAQYKDNAVVYGRVMEALFKGGIELRTAHDHMRFHILMLMVVKLTRYTQNFEDGGHADSLVDMAAYAAILQAMDAGGEVIDWTKPGAGGAPF